MDGKVIQRRKGLCKGQNDEEGRPAWEESGRGMASTGQSSHRGLKWGMGVIRSKAVGIRALNNTSVLCPDGEDGKPVERKLAFLMGLKSV